MLKADTTNRHSYSKQPVIAVHLHINNKSQNVWELNHIQECFPKAHHRRTRKKSNANTKIISQGTYNLTSKAVEVIFIKKNSRCSEEISTSEIWAFNLSHSNSTSEVMVWANVRVKKLERWGYVSYIKLFEEAFYSSEHF